jgi:hypothetical protein
MMLILKLAPAIAALAMAAALACLTLPAPLYA